MNWGCIFGSKVGHGPHKEISLRHVFEECEVGKIDLLVCPVGV